METIGSLISFAGNIAIEPFETLLINVVGTVIYNIRDCLGLLSFRRKYCNLTLLQFNVVIKKGTFRRKYCILTPCKLHVHKNIGSVF